MADSAHRKEAPSWDSCAASVDPGVAFEVAALMKIVEVPRADSAGAERRFGAAASLAARMRI